MIDGTPSVLDASALLAFLQREPGQERVAEAIAPGSAISAVNVSEVVAKLRDASTPEPAIRQSLDSLAARGLEVVPFDRSLALAAGFLRPLTRELGLSLGDRACLALGRVRGQPVLTADRGWTAVAGALGVDVRVIR